VASLALSYGGGTRIPALRVPAATAREFWLVRDVRGWRMRRLAALLLVATAGYVVLATPVAAEPDVSLNREVSGPFSGSTSFDFFTGGCSFIHQTLDGSYETQKGQSGSIHIDVCPAFSPGGAEAFGTFTLTTPHGGNLTGTVTGVYDTSAPPSIPFEFTLRAATGTKNLEHATGAILMDGLWQFDALPSPISGTLAGSLER
jgi:hypothetical protein